MNAFKCLAENYKKEISGKQDGFTLIELSIVLVVIGLIIGGVLVGKDLISASEIRQQISQIEKYNTATNSFKLKYGYMPGDIKDPEATSLGFTARGAYAGQGDGNDVLEGFTANAVNKNYGISQTGENLLFWRDLTEANLIDNALLNTATSTATTPSFGNVNLYLPNAKLSKNYIYVSRLSP